jgi:hypothetical protein
MTVPAAPGEGGAAVTLSDEDLAWLEERGGHSLPARAAAELRASRARIRALEAALGEASYHIEWNHHDEHGGHLLVEKIDALLEGRTP